jgi:TatA/E family protein of Tat protein translocase
MSLLWRGYCQAQRLLQREKGIVMAGLTGWHLLILLVVVVLLFGAKRLPDMARAVGQSMRILKAK